jgi:guanylate kinase
VKKGRLFVISGPSGAGKGTICRRLLSGKGRNGLTLSVSMTTRAPRPREKDGVSYYFVSADEFARQVARGGLLEHAEVFGNHYGTPKEPVLRTLDEGRDVLLEIDVQGALQVKANYPESLLVFILPPSMDELRRRIEGRGSESAGQIERRLDEAGREIGEIGAYDYAVVNDDIGRAVREVKSIIAGRHARLTEEDAERIIAQYAR